MEAISRAVLSYQGMNGTDGLSFVLGAVAAEVAAQTDARVERDEDPDNVEFAQHQPGLSSDLTFTAITKTYSNIMPRLELGTIAYTV